MFSSRRFPIFMSWWPWVGIAAILLGVFGLGVWVARAVLPAKLMTNRMTSATTVATIPTKIAELEQAIADITGIPINTDINAALFVVDAAGLKKVNLKDFAGNPSAVGELLRNGGALMFHDGTAARTITTNDGTATLTGKTLSAADNVIAADTAVALASNPANCSAGQSPTGVDSNGAAEECTAILNQSSLDTHAADTSTHGVTVVAGLDETQTFTGKTILAASNVVEADTALALAANGNNCSAGQAAVGVDAAGNAEGCSSILNQAALDAHAAQVNTHGVSVLVGTSESQVLTNKTLLAANNVINADTAEALAANGTNCSPGLFPQGVDTQGNAESCTDVATQTEMEAFRPAQLVANGTNCTSGQAPVGVDAAGNAEGCNDILNQDALDTHTADTTTHGIASAIVGRTETQTLTNKTILAADNVVEADTALALSANGANCSVGSTPLGVDAVGAVEGCFAVATPDSVTTLTNKTLSAANNVIEADTSLALSANGSNCSAGNFPLGVDASGAVESCTDAATQAELDTHAGLNTGVHGVGAGEVVGTALTQTLTGKTMSGASNTFSNIPNSALKTATGSATFSVSGFTLITMNDYSFFPKLEKHDCTATSANAFMHARAGDSTDNTIGEFRIQLDETCPAGAWVARWRYITASRDAEIIIVRETATGKIVAMWRSEIESGTQSPISVEKDGYETIYVADFPAEWLSLPLGQIHQELNAGARRLKAIARSGAGKRALETRAAGKGRVVIGSLPMVEVDGGGQ